MLLFSLRIRDMWKKTNTIPHPSLSSKTNFAPALTLVEHFPFPHTSRNICLHSRSYSTNNWNVSVSDKNNNHFQIQSLIKCQSQTIHYNCTKCFRILSVILLLACGTGLYLIHDKYDSVIDNFYIECRLASATFPGNVWVKCWPSPRFALSEHSLAVTSLSKCQPSISVDHVLCLAL